jgi:putative transposase
MNSLRGRCENFWSSDAPCVVELVDPADVMDKLVYAATNPVAGLLVERVHHWPGVNGLGALLAGRTLTVKRPRHFFRADGDAARGGDVDVDDPAGARGCRGGAARAARAGGGR